MTKLNKIAILAVFILPFLACSFIGDVIKQIPVSPIVTPTATATAVVATATNVPTATPAPTSGYSQILPTDCDQRPSTFIGEFRAAVQRYQDKHPEQFDGAYFKLPLSQDIFFLGIREELAGHGLSLVIDPCMCGDVQVSTAGTLLGSGFQEGYHPLGSDRLVQSAPYKGACSPKWVDYIESAATAEPTKVASVICPPVLTIDVFPLSNGRYVSQDGGHCMIMNLTPRFLVNGKNVPGNAEHPLPGISGDQCEPAFDSVAAVFTSVSGPSWATKEYLGRICGPDGSSWQVNVKLKPGAVDKTGRLVNVSEFSPYIIRGTI